METTTVQLKGETLERLKYFKEYSKEIVSILKSVLKNPRKIPEIILSQDKEYEILNDNKGLMEKEFNVNVEIIKGMNEKAYPGKVAIVLEK